MELPKIPSVVLCKDLQEGGRHSIVKEVGWKLVELHGVVGSKEKSSKVIDG